MLRFIGACWITLGIMWFWVSGVAVGTLIANPHEVDEYKYMLYFDHTYNGNDLVSDAFTLEEEIDSKKIAEDAFQYYDIWLLNLEDLENEN